MQQCSFFFFFNDTATTEIYTLSLHDALPISKVFFRLSEPPVYESVMTKRSGSKPASGPTPNALRRSEEHTSELQSRLHLVCRLLLEKKKNMQAQVNERATRGDD